MSKEVGFSYGIMSDLLEEQANKQGYTFGKSIEKFEKLKFSLNMVVMHDIITDSQSQKCFQKLHKKVMESIKPLEK